MGLRWDGGGRREEVCTLQCKEKAPESSSATNHRRKRSEKIKKMRRCQININPWAGKILNRKR